MARRGFGDRESILWKLNDVYGGTELEVRYDLIVEQSPLRSTPR